MSWEGYTIVILSNLLTPKCRIPTPSVVVSQPCTLRQADSDRHSRALDVDDGRMQESIIVETRAQCVGVEDWKGIDVSTFPP